MNALDDVREVILETVSERLDLDRAALEKLRANGRLDEFTAVDSLLMVELVLMLEERFDIRFDPEKIGAELISDLDLLSAFVESARANC